MSIASAQLPAALQTLIDCRLDTIDRMLLGRVPRQDRVAIVREVESQVFELLNQHGDAELSREDVLGVLARLDPPEAYLADDDDEPDASSATPRSRPVAVRTVGGSSAIAGRKWAKAAGITGIVSLSLVVLSPLLYLFAGLLASASEILAYVFIFGMLGMMFIGAVISIALGLMHVQSGIWPKVGLFTGIASLLATVALGFLLFMVL